MSRRHARALANYPQMPPSKKEPSLSEVGERIEKARKALGLTQSDLGQVVGLKQSQVSRIENGERGLEAASLMLLLQELRRRGINTDYIISGAEPVLLVSDTGILGELRELLARHQLGPEQSALANKRPRAPKNGDKP